jgi:hypothetical protein
MSAGEIPNSPKRQEVLVDIREITKRCRKPIYTNDEERHDAKLRQTIESNRRKKQEKLDFLNRISIQYILSHIKVN